MWADPDDISTFERAVTPKTKAIFIKFIANPGGVITDIEAVSNIARKARVPLIDRQHGGERPTCATDSRCGADVVVHSAHEVPRPGTAPRLGGVVVECRHASTWSREGTLSRML